jgi:hypothetical protein
MRQKLLRALILALPLINGVAVLAIGIARQNWPNGPSWHWTDHERLLIGALCVTAGIPLIQTLISERGERARRKELELADDLRALLVPTFLVLARDCDAPWDTTAVQVFGLTGFSSRRRHKRLAKIRIAPIAASGVFWSKGKGVIGRCWETKTSQWVELDFNDIAVSTEEEWQRLPNEKTFGLSWSDFKALGHKYGTVAAVPIMKATDGSDNYIGCVSLDTPKGVTLKNRDKALESLAASADVIARRLATR